MRLVSISGSSRTSSGGYKFGPGGIPLRFHGKRERPYTLSAFPGFDAFLSGIAQRLLPHKGVGTTHHLCIAWG